MSVKSGLVILTCIFLTILQVACAKWNSNIFGQKMYALAKAFKYMEERPSQMNTDTIFGVTCAEANLQAAFHHKNAIYIDSYQRDFLGKLWILSQQTRSTLQANEKPGNDIEARLSTGVNRPHIWIRPIVWRKMMLEKSLAPNPDLTAADAKDSMFRGRPQPEESDKCLLDLIDDCRFSEQCRDVVVSRNSSNTGYPLTHRLLIKQMITAYRCNTSISRFLPYLGFNFCSSILQDLINIEAMGFPDVGKDLALEQVFLCGMEGYLDFLDSHYEQLILDWQHSSGCYHGFIDYRRLRKRAASFTDFGCINHTTGLAAAALALMIRKDIETFKTL